MSVFRRLLCCSRGGLSCKRRPPEVMEVTGDPPLSGGVGDGGEATEMDKFLPHSDKSGSGGSCRYVNVQPANVECNVYEEVAGRPSAPPSHDDKRKSLQQI